MRTGTPLPALRRALGGIGLGLCIAGALVAAAGLHWQARGDRRTVWVLVDRSLSAGDAAERKLPAVLRDLAASLGENDYVGVIGFSDTAQILMQPQPARGVNADLRLPRVEAADETWLASALELAAQHKLPDSEAFALLIGDGHDSSLRYGIDLQREARQAGVRLFTLATDSEPLPESAIADCFARLAGEDQRLLAIDLVVFSTVSQRVTPEIKLNGESVSAVFAGGAPIGPVAVGPGRTPLRLIVEPRRRLATYVVEVTLAAEQNSYPRNDSIKLAVRGPGEARVLLLHGESGPERALLRALGRAGIEVTMGDASIMPGEAMELAQFQSVILSDVPATDLTPAQLTLINRFVRDGGGLAMIGGPRSFAPGGYYETPVEAVLPVTCDVVEKGRKQNPVLVVVLDRSGSMSAQVGNYTKMELANEGCVRAIELAPPGSLFGMLSVDTQNHWIVPIEPLRDRKTAVTRARTNSVGGGGIYTDIAMREALRALRSVTATSKHIVLFSDGEDTERQEGVADMVKQALRDDKITVSTICMGRGRDYPFLRDLAAVGGGRSFLVEDASQLPAVFSREAALSGGAFLREDPFKPWPGRQGTLNDGVDFRAADSPDLLGFVAVTARNQADVWLWADEEKERPLLATWNVELGRALAFTSDARDRWANRWLPWQHYDELWQRWARWLLPPPEGVAGVEPEWTVGRHGPALTLRFFDDKGNPRELVNPVAETTLPDGTSMEGKVTPVGSGTYRVQFNRAGAGMYAASVRERPLQGDERLAAREMQVFVPLDELLRRPADRTALAAVARATSGSLVLAASELAQTRAEGSRERLSLGQALLWLAALGLLLGIGARRMPSVWRSQHAEASRRKEESRVLSARDAFERVRKTLEDRQRAPDAARIVHPPAAPARVAPPPHAPPPAPAAAERRPELADSTNADNSLLSAVRKVRKQLDQGKDQP
ncbi:MAG: VWA domain-containing protein [Planctomycetes bacterium]|nr:VWA domain-containing protein [Planctomycetota bacterium]